MLPVVLLQHLMPLLGCCSPPTALCMLEAIVQLQPGDTVVQNGATSAVGQVCNFCRDMRHNRLQTVIYSCICGSRDTVFSMIWAHVAM